MDGTVAATNRWIICRICLKNSSNEMVKLFNGSDSNLVSKIEECGGVVLSTAPNLPDSICKKCLTLLRAATKFREKIRRSQQELIEQFLLQPDTDEQKELEMQEEFEFITMNNTQSEDMVCNKATNTELTEPEDNNSVHSNAEPLVYSLECQDVASEIISVDASSAKHEESFEVLDRNDKLCYVDQDIDNLELVLHLEGEKNVNSFKIVPQFKTSTVKTTQNRSKEVLPTRQRKRNAVHEARNAQSNHNCPHCGNSYTEKSKLSLHMKIHTKEKPHQCEICFKRFGQTPQLARHMNSHTGSRPFTCRYCTSSFADPSTRIKHERIHTNERPYQCTVCEKAFSYSNVLKVHMMTHTGEKPYICKYCGKQFSQAHHKKKHERLHENTSLEYAKVEETQGIV